MGHMRDRKGAMEIGLINGNNWQLNWVCTLQESVHWFSKISKKEEPRKNTSWDMITANLPLGCGCRMQTQRRHWMQIATLQATRLLVAFHPFAIVPFERVFQWTTNCERYISADCRPIQRNQFPPDHPVKATRNAVPARPNVPLGKDLDLKSIWTWC